MPTVWAVSAGAPGKTCADARLLGGGTKLEYPKGTEVDPLDPNKAGHGQAGWDIGVGFQKPTDLAQILTSLKKQGNSISRLAINLHGAPGRIDADSLGPNYDTAYDWDRLWKTYQSPLQEINQAIASGAMVLIMGCNVAAGDVGKQFLKNLSTKVFPEHEVVGFSMVGVTAKQYRAGGKCSEPGMRDSNFERTPPDLPPKEQADRENQYLTLQWASHESPHACVVRNGTITKLPAHEVNIQTDYSLEQYLVGSWLAETVGDNPTDRWQGYFVFRADKTCAWQTITHVTRGNATGDTGTWKVIGNKVEWQYTNDRKNNNGRQRIFRLEGPMKTNMTCAVEGGDSGVFSMTKQ